MKVCFGMPRLHPFMYHYSSQSELSHRIENLYYKETMKRKTEGKWFGARVWVKEPRVQVWQGSVRGQPNFGPTLEPPELQNRNSRARY